MKLNKEENGQAVCKRVAKNAMDVHSHRIRIPINLSKVVDAQKAMETIIPEACVSNLSCSTESIKEETWWTNTKPNSSNIQGRSAVQNNLLSVMSTLPASNSKLERQLKLLFGIPTPRNSRRASEHLDIEVGNDRYFYLQQL
jgi:hypothetical protein